MPKNHCRRYRLAPNRPDKEKQKNNNFPWRWRKDIKKDKENMKQKMFLLLVNQGNSKFVTTQKKLSKKYKI